MLYQCFVVIPDIFGIEGGRTRQVCDYYASKGYLVILPGLLVAIVPLSPFSDWFRGHPLTPETLGTFGPWLNTHSKEAILADYKQSIMPYVSGYSVGLIGCIVLS